MVQSWIELDARNDIVYLYLSEALTQVDFCFIIYSMNELSLQSISIFNFFVFAIDVADCKISGKKICILAI